MTSSCGVYKKTFLLRSSSFRAITKTLTRLKSLVRLEKTRDKKADGTILQTYQLIPKSGNKLNQLKTNLCFVWCSMSGNKLKMFRNRNQQIFANLVRFASSKTKPAVCVHVCGFNVNVEELKNVKINAKEKKHWDDCTEEVVQVEMRLTLIIRPAGKWENHWNMLNFNPWCVTEQMSCQ